jgi:hypothetical protein
MISSDIFRRFVNSTSGDMVNECNALDKRVHSQLRLCNGYGAHLLPIDLRWATSEKATYKPQTVAIS